VRVIIVDDDRFVRQALVREIGARWEALAVASGGELFAVLDDTACAVVVDRFLGEGEDGIEVLRAVRRLRPSCVRVLLSGLALDDTRAEALALEGVVHGVFGKPWRYGEVRERLEELLTSREAACAGAVARDP
jgi:DNA-binding response OmpR family regulator